jgi:hypothetical protein
LTKYVILGNPTTSERNRNHCWVTFLRVRSSRNYLSFAPTAGILFGHLVEDCGPKPSCDQEEAPDGQRRPHPPSHHHHHHPSQVHPAPSSSLQMLPAQEDEEHERELALCKKSVPRLSPSSGTDRERGSVEISGKTAQTDFDLGCNEISLHSKRKSSRRISRITPADGQEVEAQEEKGGEPPGEPLTGNEEIV